MVRYLLLLFLLSFLFSGCLLKDENFDVFSEDFDTLTWEVNRVDTLEVATVNGNIRAYQNDKNTIDAIIYKRSWGLNFKDAEEHLNDIKIYQSQSGNIFKLSADIPSIDRKYVASFSLNIPDSLFLDFFIIDGDLSVENLISDVKFRVDNGSIETKLVTGDLKLEIINGGIAILDHKGNIQAETLNGSIFCSMLDILSGESIEIKTTAGGVALQIPVRASIAFEISTRTGSMSITGFDDIIYTRNEFNFRTGEINGGEASVIISCNTGNINIQSF